MIYYEPLSLYEAYAFVCDISNGFSLNSYMNKQMLRDPESRREYASYLETLLQLDEKLRSALPVDEAVFHDLCDSIKPSGGKRGGQHSKTAEICLFNTILPSVEELVTEREGFIEYLNAREAKLPELIAETLLPSDESADMADTLNIFGLINASGLPQNIKNLFCDAAANPSKYVAMVKDIMLSLADEFEACRPIWRSLIAPYRDSYEEYGSDELLISEKFNTLGLEDARELEMYPSIIGFRFCLFRPMDKLTKKVKCNVGALYDVFRSNANRAANRASLVSRMMNVLGDQTRFNLFARLADESCYGRELANEFSLSPGTVSEHLGILTGLDLIASKNDGRKMYYYLNYPKVRQFLEFQREIFLKNDPENAAAAETAPVITELPKPSGSKDDSSLVG